MAQTSQAAQLSPLTRQRLDLGQDQG